VSLAKHLKKKRVEQKSLISKSDFDSTKASHNYIGRIVSVDSGSDVFFAYIQVIKMVQSDLVLEFQKFTEYDEGKTLFDGQLLLVGKDISKWNDETDNSEAENRISKIRKLNYSRLFVSMKYCNVYAISLSRELNAISETDINSILEDLEKKESKKNWICSCNCTNDGDANYCKKCSRGKYDNLEAWTCNICSTANQSKAKFCSECGNKRNCQGEEEEEEEVDSN